jgi:hypothetical protein
MLRWLLIVDGAYSDDKLFDGIGNDNDDDDDDKVDNGCRFGTSPRDSMVALS